MMSLLPSVRTSMLNRCSCMNDRRGHCHLLVRGTQVAVVLLTLAAHALAQSTQSVGRFAEQLRRESNDLIQRCVQRPYGWGLSAELDDQQSGPRQARQPTVAMDSLETPAAAIVLLWSSDLLSE